MMVIDQAHTRRLQSELSHLAVDTRHQYHRKVPCSTCPFAESSLRPSLLLLFPMSSLLEETMQIDWYLPGG